MAERVKLGLIYSYNENWIGGTYYIENLVNSLNLVEDTKKPQIIVLIAKPKDREQFNKRTNYPYIRFRFFTRPNNYWLARIDFLFKRFTNRNLFNVTIKKDSIDIIFPYHDKEVFKNVSKKVYWITDFQELHLQEYFTKRELELRHNNRSSIANRNSSVVFSSQHASKDYENNYKSKGRSYVIPFAVHHPASLPKIEDTLDKYGIEKPYFIVCNQFWQHKNHQVVLESLAILNKKDIKFKVVFTGKDSDHRKGSPFDQLMEMARKSKITEHIIMLGFIPRSDQLALIKGSRAVIQPSFFEGWSTVVEDAKALHTPIILSDIEVHREQNPSNALFFDPKDAKALSDIMTRDIPNKISETRYFDHQVRFGERFINMIDIEMASDN